MKIVTYHDNRIASIRENIEYEVNGNVLLGDGTGIASTLVKGVYEVDEVPEEIVTEKYCYTEESGFYINKNYKEPIDESAEIKKLQEQVTNLELALTEIYESGV